MFTLTVASVQDVVQDLTLVRSGEVVQKKRREKKKLKLDNNKFKFK